MPNTSEPSKNLAAPDENDPTPENELTPAADRVPAETEGEVATDESSVTVEDTQPIAISASMSDESSECEPGSEPSNEGAESDEIAEADAEADSELDAELAEPRRKLPPYTWPLVGCAASLVTGFFASWMLTAPPLEVIPEAPAVVATKPNYVATIIRRSEPISPLVPFDELNPEIVDLGKRLFHDPGLSGNGMIACASCHDVAEGGDDGLPVSIGYNDAAGKFNAPTVLNAALNFAQFWDGRAATLEEQIEGPIANPVEMASDWPRITTYLTHNESYSEHFERLMGGPPTPDRVKEAIATYERSLITVDSDFDRWLAGNEQALGADEYGGYFLFKKLNCLACHQGAGVGGTMFQRLGKMKDYFNKAHPPQETDYGRYNITGDERDRYVFRVPTLRNVELTGPYFHDGSAVTLEQAVTIMIEHQLGLEANAEDVRRLVAFLKALTGKIPQ